MKITDIHKVTTIKASIKTLGLSLKVENNLAKCKAFFSCKEYSSKNNFSLLNILSSFIADRLSNNTFIAKPVCISLSLLHFTVFIFAII